jgi:hypothetical protein
LGDLWLLTPKIAKVKEGVLMKNVSMALLILTLLVVQPVAAGQGSPDAPVSLRITTSALRGNPGDTVTISGSGAIAGRAVFVTLSPQADSAAGAFITKEVAPAANGTFSLVLTIPADVPDGIYFVRAEQFSSDGAVLQYYWNTFTVGVGGKGPLLPVNGGVMTRASPETLVILGLAVVVMMLSRGTYAVAKRPAE